MEFIFTAAGRESLLQALKQTELFPLEGSSEPVKKYNKCNNYG